MGKISVLYVVGFFVFCELLLIIEVVKKLEMELDLFLFDGNGYLYYNYMGVVIYVVFFFGKLIIGIVKIYFKIKGCDFVMFENKVGVYIDIIIDGEVYGWVLWMWWDVKFIFLFCGNYIDLESSY